MAHPRFRTDIQALRALAVLLVVVHHVWPHRLHGGYVGVDVFFVISGFLITTHLMRELEETGRVRLGRFYARRIRRLLPAALTVLLVSAVLVWVLLPFSRWDQNAQEIVASAFYVENWRLAADAVDYSASQNLASTAQHYWSLSVEEQFYAIWPILLIAFAWVFSKLRRRADRELESPWRVPASRGVLAALVIVALVSLPLSEWWITEFKQAAYFATPGRLWEFAIGGFVGWLGMAASRRGLQFEGRTASAVGLILTLAGWAGIAFTALTYTQQTRFPGYSALLPVLSTALVIAVGTFMRVPRPAALLYGLHPVQRLGDISYSVYLWHWPLVVIAPFVVGEHAGRLRSVFILLATWLLAEVTFRWVEPWGKRAGVNAPLWRVFATTAAAMALIAVVGWGQTRHAEVVAAKAGEAQDSIKPDRCVGPDALVSSGCDTLHKPVEFTAMGDANKYWRVGDNCKGTGVKVAGKLSEYSCDFSGGDPKAKTVYLIGDSHAQHWQGGLEEVARRNHWKLKSLFVGGCAVADVPYTGYTSPAPDGGASCRQTAKAMRDRVLQVKPDRVVYSLYSRAEHVETGPGETEADVWKRGLPVFWRQWADAGIAVDVLGDPPVNAPLRTETCLPTNAETPDKCAVPRKKALAPDPLREAVKAADDPRIRLIDTTKAFCDEERCYAAAGGIAVYYNKDHLNREYARLMGPYLDELITGNREEAGRG